ncbi:MAG: uracil-DNA glycosylase [Leptospirales bacterium]
MDRSPEEDIGDYLRYLEKNIPNLAFLSSGKDLPKGDLMTSLSGNQKKGSPEPRRLNSIEEDVTELDNLRLMALSCQRCSLAETRQNVVFGEGSGHSGLMFVGEGPGADEDRTGRPFVGRAGDLLTKMILAMGLKREDVYIANTVKCRPPGNRVPAPEERESCSPFLLDQIRILKPRYMVLLGQTAMQTLLSRPEGISRLRGQECRLVDFPGVRVLPTYHPAYLLRNPNAKRDVWSDLQTVMNWMGLPLPK